MRSGRSIFLALLVLWATVCSLSRREQKKAPPEASARGAPQAIPRRAEGGEPDLFQSEVRGILRQRCAPCHEAGGKMYERLPFDNREVVLSNRDSILRRLKAPEEQEAFRRFIATARKAASNGP